MSPGRVKYRRDHRGYDRERLAPVQYFHCSRVKDFKNNSTSSSGAALKKNSYNFRLAACWGTSSEETVMPNEKTEPRATWTSREAYLLALVCLTTGLLVGYLLHGSSPGLGPVVGPTPGATPAASGTGMPLSGAPAAAGAAATAASLQPQAAPLLAALNADPKHVETLVQLGNLYYDNRVYPEAIEYYTRALDVRPNDINVRTDLGTAYWYSGSPEKAVKEYEKSLAIDPSHPNTLFNMGVVRSEGLKDNVGAIAAWEKLLNSNPQYPEKQKILDLIAKARSQ